MSESNHKIGMIIQGRYELVRLLGDGGMGSVFKAADLLLKRFVAIKLLRSTISQNSSTIDRFIQEARAAARIGHPNIIDILDFGYEGAQPFIVMEYLKGKALSNIIANEKPLSIARACSIATHTLAGLSAVHSRGILHRDLKPANLMLVSRLGDRDFVKICDFGFATLLLTKDSSSQGRSITPARTLVGTPAYASPERLRGQDTPDPRIDLYSLGVVLYEMLAGRRPFEGSNFGELSKKIKNENPLSLRAIRPEIPLGLEEIVMRSLSKQKENRWASAEEFASALVLYGGHKVLRTDDDEPSDSYAIDLLTFREQNIVTNESSSVNQSAQRPAYTDLTISAAIRRAAENSHSPQNFQVIQKPPSVEIDLLWDDENTKVDHDVKAHALLSTVPQAIEPPTFSTRKVSGTIILGVTQLVTTRFGSRALKEIIDHLPATVRPTMQNRIEPTDWVSFDVYESLQLSIDRHFGRDDLHLIAQCGQGAAQNLLSSIHQLIPVGTPAEVILTEMPRILQKGFRGIEGRVRSIGRGYGKIEIIDDPQSHTLTTCVSLLGFLNRCFTESSAKKVEVTTASCSALGDQQCIFDLSWIAS